MHILTLDLGSGALKAGLWQGGVLLRSLEAPITTQWEGDAAEQAPREWWTAAERLVRSLDAHPAEAIAVTGHMHALVPTSADGEPLGPVAVIPDRRARAAYQALEAELGAAQIHRWTGGCLDPTCALAKAVYFAQDPAWRAARWLLPPKDFLRMRLTGQAATDPTDAAGTMLWDIRRGEWHTELAAFAGDILDKLPPVLPTLSVAGIVTDRAAERLGLRPGIPVVTCGGDDIETLGAGAITPGDLFEHLGTTGSVYLATDQLHLDPDGRVEAYPDVVPGRWLLGGSTSTAGAAIRWVFGMTGGDADWTEVERLSERMAAGTPSEITFLPYLAGERAPLWNPQRSGAFLGLHAFHDTDAVRQAVLEGVLYSLCAVRDSLIGLAPMTGQIFTAGPLGRLKSLGQIRADLYGIETACLGATAQTTSLAAMILAACTLTGQDPYAMASRLLPRQWQFSPRLTAQHAYARGYRRYLRADSLLADFDAPLEAEETE